MASSLPTANELRLELQSAVQALSILVFPGREQVGYSESTPTVQDKMIMRLPGMRLSRVSPEKGEEKTICITFGLPRFCGAASQCSMGS